MASNPNQYQVAHPEERSLGASLGRLPGQYVRAVFTPSPRTFERESEYAHWGAVWLQLLLLIVIPSLLGLFRSLFHDTSSGISATSNVAFFIVATLTVGATIGAFILKLIVVPLFFFIITGAQFLVARAFRGSGPYLDQCYAALLYQVPLEIIGGIIITVVVILHRSTFLLSPLVAIVLFLYSIFLNITAIMGVHRLDRGRAAAAVFIPYIVGVLLACGLTVYLAHQIVNALRSIGQ